MRYRDASASEYESMIHCCAPNPIPKSLRIAGSATLIAVTEAIDEPSTVAASVRRRHVASVSGVLPRKTRSKRSGADTLDRQGVGVDPARSCSLLQPAQQQMEIENASVRCPGIEGCVWVR